MIPSNGGRNGEVVSAYLLCAVPGRLYPCAAAVCRLAARPGRFPSHYLSRYYIQPHPQPPETGRDRSSAADCGAILDIGDWVRFDIHHSRVCICPMLCRDAGGDDLAPIYHDIYRLKPIQMSTSKRLVPGYQRQRVIGWDKCYNRMYTVRPC